jgi:hypothetical protein
MVAAVIAASASPTKAAISPINVFQNPVAPLNALVRSAARMVVVAVVVRARRVKVASLTAPVWGAALPIAPEPNAAVTAAVAPAAAVRPIRFAISKASVSILVDAPPTAPARAAARMAAADCADNVPATGCAIRLANVSIRRGAAKPIARENNVALTAV